MTCDDARRLLDAFVDAQLDLVPTLEFERHLACCPACAHAVEARRGLVGAIARNAPYYAAPARVRGTAVAAARRVARTPRGRPQRWLAAAVATVAVVALAVIAVRLPALRRTGQLADDIVAGHVRSLMADHLTDVASTDRHTVKPWFAGKLDFAPQPIDLRDAGFQLVGGRLDYLHDRAIAALVFRRGNHVVNVFEWPASTDGSAGPVALERRGYNLVHWTSRGLECWAVSDVNADELRRLASELSRTE